MIEKDRQKEWDEWKDNYYSSYTDLFPTIKISNIPSQDYHYRFGFNGTNGVRFRHAEQFAQFIILMGYDARRVK